MCLLLHVCVYVSVTCTAHSHQVESDSAMHTCATSASRSVGDRRWRRLVGGVVSSMSSSTANTNSSTSLTMPTSTNPGTSLHSDAEDGSRWRVRCSSKIPITSTNHMRQMRHSTLLCWCFCPPVLPPDTILGRMLPSMLLVFTVRG